MKAAVLAEVTRGSLVESRHRGHIAVVRAEGQMLAWAGDPYYRTYLRSAAKPIQAVAVLESGAAEYFALSSEEKAILTSSHSGEQEQIAVIKGILQKLGLTQEALQCGTHQPLNKESAQALWAKGLKPNALHCTCSGKHAGMLALARFRGWPLETYTQCRSPLQQVMLSMLADFAGLDPTEIITGQDGCSVPVFALTMAEMARAYARLVRPEGFSEPRKKACREVTAVMTAHPYMVAGTGRLATILMEATRGKLIAKDGAEGVLCLGFIEQGLGLALKIEDGSDRALGPVVIRVLEALNLLAAEEKKLLKAYAKTELKNFRGEPVAEIHPAKDILVYNREERQA